VNARAIECPWCGSGSFPNCCWLAQHAQREHFAEERRKREKARELMPLAKHARVTSIDFLARLADAWDFKGQNVFRATGDEHRALLELAQLPRELADLKWCELDGRQREALTWAARRAIEFGRQCAWVFGEGQGAR